MNGGLSFIVSGLCGLLAGGINMNKRISNAKRFNSIQDFSGNTKRLSSRVSMLRTMVLKIVSSATTHHIRRFRAHGSAITVKRLVLSTLSPWFSMPLVRPRKSL